MNRGLVSSLDFGDQFNWCKHICERSRDLQNPSLAFSLWDFIASTSVVQIGSPRSLAACDAQGILPKDTWWQIHCTQTEWHRRWPALFHQPPWPMFCTLGASIQTIGAISASRWDVHNAALPDGFSANQNARFGPSSCSTPL